MVPQLELIQEGNTGLMRAIERFTGHEKAVFDVRERHDNAKYSRGS